ncbi:MAG TPA: methyltransferase domain-containing protein, partial [Vicinamibacterales bacterium]|nr:methyltransferase domain-containing protein [Vicinamibacterales bacterium]
EFPEAQGVVVGMTDSLVEEAVARRSASGYENRLQIVPVGLSGLEDLRCGSFDLCFALDHVLDVAEDPRWILDHIVRITRPGGLVISLVRNVCDAVSASLADARIEEAEQALTGKGRCVANASELNLFTSASIEELIKAAGASPCATVGVPATLPQRRLDVHGGHASSVAEMLSNCESLERILRIERALLDQRGGAQRGSHLLSIAVVPLRGSHWGDFWLTDLERDCSKA